MRKNRSILQLDHLMHRIRLLVSALALTLSGSVVGTTKPLLTPDSRFEVTGDWRGGSTPGHASGRGTIYCNSPNATATWLPSLHSICPVRISFWISPHENNSPGAKIEFGRPGSTLETRIIDLRSEPPQWKALGVLRFEGAGAEIIRLSNTTRGNLRASALKLEILDPQDPKMVWQTLILDELAAYDQAILRQSIHSFKDIPDGDPLLPIAARLTANGILSPTRPDHFSPGDLIPTNHFLAALCKLLENQTIDPNDGASLRRHAMEQRWFQKQPSDMLQRRDAKSILVNAAKNSGRALDWIGRDLGQADTDTWSLALGITLAGKDPAFPADSRGVTRAQAAWMLARFQSALIHSGPPGNGWELSFSDDFNGPSLRPEIWTVSHKQTWGKLLSIRMKSNVVQENGWLRLFTRKEKVGDKEWTTGMVGTGKNFRQAYGYWEARMRYADAPGLNNAFWTNPGKDPNGKPGWEIDINEGHWPNTINASLHQDGLASLSKAWRAPVDLSKEFNTYGCLWNENEIIYYWNGTEVDRKPNTHAKRPSPVIFSTAVFPWAGSITDALHNKSMDVDWVRIWKPKTTGSQAPESSEMQSHH